MTARPALPRFSAALFLLVALSGRGAEQATPPAPFGPLPTETQVAWHGLEFYAFVHFTVNTFTGKEWGYGDESPELFNPAAFDPEQIVLTVKNAGMKGLILTTKHHDGFCLWPTKTTGHNITTSPYRNGKGDIVGEIVAACRKHGIKVGMYLSPWDRNSAHYGKPEYIEQFRAQLTELLTNYGEVFEVWFDGANGGDGFYGGARETRRIDKLTYYDWENTWAMIRKLQPGAAIFSDIGPDCRWVGTEAGHSGDPCWHRYTPQGRDGGKPGNGATKYWESMNGHREGKFWMPAETNTSIRPGWFYHDKQDGRVKNGERLIQHYYESIGHGTTFLLNLPPDKRGLIHENDVAALTEFRRILDATFGTDLAAGAKLSASSVRGESFSAGNPFGLATLQDGDPETYWAAPDGTTTAAIMVDFGKPTAFNVVNLRENIRLGQRIWGWGLDRWQDGAWTEFASGESIGHRRLWRGPLQTTSMLRFRITEAPVSPVLSELSVHLEPVRLSPPAIERDKEGIVTLKSTGEIRYTLDGSEPRADSLLYTKPLDLSRGGDVKARVFYNGEESGTRSAHYTCSRHRWKIVSASSETKGHQPHRVLDGNRHSSWNTSPEDAQREIVIDFEEEIPVLAFTMLPLPGKEKEGIVTRYALSLSRDGKTWSPADEGEFSNIINNPIEQQIPLSPPQTARYAKFRAVTVVGGKHAAVAELGVVAAD